MVEPDDLVREVLRRVVGEDSFERTDGVLWVVTEPVRVSVYADASVVDGYAGLSGEVGPVVRQEQVPFVSRRP